MFADLGWFGRETRVNPSVLAHNMRERGTDDPSEILPELDNLPRRMSYSMKPDEPMKIIKWMNNQENHEKVREITERYSVKDTPTNHVPTRMDFVIPSTKNGKPIYPTSVLQKKPASFLDDIREAVRGELESLTTGPPFKESFKEYGEQPSSVASSNVSPEGIKADSPDASVIRRYDSDSF